MTMSEKVLHESAKCGPLHGEVLGNGAPCGHDELALAEHLSSFGLMSNFRVRITGVISFLVPYQSTYAPKHPLWGVKP